LVTGKNKGFRFCANSGKIKKEGCVKMNEDERKKIIYLDDVYHSLVTVQNKIKDKYELYPVQTAEKMFELLDKFIPDMILIDINMPEIDGFQAIQQLKANSKYKDIPVVFITGKRDKDTVKKGISLGAVDFISKPASTSDITDCIELNLDPEKKGAERPVILAIDDDSSILNSINALLQDRYTLYTMPGVQNDRVLKELLKKIAPDLFLLDCNMPGLNGFDLVPIIKDTPTFEDTPIIFLTADGTIDNVSVAMTAHVSDFIVKPIDKEVLVSKLEMHLKNFLVWRHMRANRYR
jgi:putative two-component system response regulator